MYKIYWELGSFSISMQGRYASVNELEKDIEQLYGSEDLGGFSGNDWFLINKKTNNLEFLSLTVPSYFFDLTSVIQHTIDNLDSINLEQFLKKSASNIKMQDSAFFSADKDILLISKYPSQVEAQTELSDNFFLLSDKKGEYLGCILYNATKSIYGYNKTRNSSSFIDCLQEMLTLCNEPQYDLMDDEDSNSLQKLNKLESQSIEQSKLDPRAEHILTFVRNAKSTFYDIN